MRILQLIQKPQLRGAEIFSAQLSENLQIQGHKVCLVSLFTGNAPLPFSGKIDSLNRSLYNRLLDVKGWYLLHQYIKENKPDVVQANAGDTLKFAVFSKLIFRWKTPIIFRNANKVSDFINSKTKLWFNKFLVNQVSHVVSVSELCRQDFIRTYNYPEQKITTISIGINTNEEIGHAPADLKNIFSVGKVIVHVASFVPEKNHDGLLRIFKSLLKENPFVQLVLLGDGRLKRDLEQKIKELNISNKVQLLGYRKDVLDIISNAQVFVLPSLIEGLPGVILEAMYCKTPVIAYNVGGISEVVKHKETGWLIEKNNEDAFINAINEVLDSDVNIITNQAYSLATQQYDNKIIAQKFEELYKEMIAKSNSN